MLIMPLIVESRMDPIASRFLHSLVLSMANLINLVLKLQIDVSALQRSTITPVAPNCSIAKTRIQ